MTQVLTFPEPIASLAVRRPGREKFSDEDYWAFCQANPDLRLERTAEGEIVILPFFGGESGYRNACVVAELGVWADKDGSGKAFGPTVQFFLPAGSGLSPGAA